MLEADEAAEIQEVQAWAAGTTTNARSSAGRSRISFSQRIGLVVCVRVARPAWWSEASSNPTAIPTDSST